LITILAFTSCGGDDSQAPDDDGNGNEEVFLSAENPDEWSVLMLHYTTNPSSCVESFERVTDIGDVLRDGTFRLRTYSYQSGTCCVRERYASVTIETTELLDFTGYKTARFKGEVRMYMQRALGGCGAEVEVDICGVRLVSERVCGDTGGEVVLTETYDVNISDVLDCVRGSASIRISVGGGCGTGALTDNEIYVEVRDLRIVVTR
jgi:hypothetical protein